MDDKLFLSGTIGADGTETLVISPTSVRGRWTVKQISVNGAIPGAIAVGAGAQCAAFLNNIGNLITGLRAQNGVASGDPYVPINFGERILIRWSGATVGAAVSAVVLYDDGQGAR